MLERASARETATRVAAGAFCRLLLAHFGIHIGSHTVGVGPERIANELENLKTEEVLAVDAGSKLRCADRDAERRMIALIDEAEKKGTRCLEKKWRIS